MKREKMNVNNQINLCSVFNMVSQACIQSKLLYFICLNWFSKSRSKSLCKLAAHISVQVQSLDMQMLFLKKTILLYCSIILANFGTVQPGKLDRFHNEWFRVLTHVGNFLTYKNRHTFYRIANNLFDLVPIFTQYNMK